jgi:L-alanine-DL-glutamate epimerase-like enolase superfamily enzyme
VKITAIRLDRMRLVLDPPFDAAWDSVPRRHFDATLVRVETDAGITGYGSGDTMDGFEAFAEEFIGKDPLQIANHVKALETISFHAGRYWPLEAALWDILGKACGQPVATLFGGAADRLPACARTVAELAVQQGHWFTPHTWTNGLGLLANLHVAAGVGGGPYLEFPYDPPGWTPRRRDFFLAQPVTIEADGMVRVPGEPGLGVEIDEDAVARWAVDRQTLTR